MSISIPRLVNGVKSPKPPAPAMGWRPAPISPPAGGQGHSSPAMSFNELIRALSEAMGNKGNPSMGPLGQGPGVPPIPKRPMAPAAPASAPASDRSIFDMIRGR